MSAALERSWTQDQFLAWAEAQELRYEFDGTRPVAMTGGTIGHGQITGNLNTALRSRLRKSPCTNHGPDTGVQTAGSKVRYPDGLITCSNFRPTDKLAPNPIIVFEVLSPTSGGTDRIEKVREYAPVPSILRYVIVESATPGLMVLHRETRTAPWTTLTLTMDDALPLPEVGLEIPVDEFYDGVEFEPPAQDRTA
jgi:Uma2 family endonuclease